MQWKELEKILYHPFDQRLSRVNDNGMSNINDNGLVTLSQIIYSNCCNNSSGNGNILTRVILVGDTVPVKISKR